MPETAASKIQNLLTRAARQTDPAATKDSSVASATLVLPTETEAENLFSEFHRKLFLIEQWNNCSNISTFELFDKTGNAPPKKPAAVGDFVKIILPASGKDDWVKISEITEAQDEIILTLQPSHDPTDKENKPPTSHFFTDDSSNNFCLQKKAAKINFYVIGIDEVVNTEETSGVIESVRNFATAKLGRFLGIQKAHWETFCRKFLEIEKTN